MVPLLLGGNVPIGVWARRLLAVNLQIRGIPRRHVHGVRERAHDGRSGWPRRRKGGQRAAEL